MHCILQRARFPWFTYILLSAEQSVWEEVAVLIGLVLPLDVPDGGSWGERHWLGTGAIVFAKEWVVVTWLHHHEARFEAGVLYLSSLKAS